MRPKPNRLTISGCLLAAMLVIAAADAFAQRSKSLNVTTSFVVDSQAKLSLSESAISFPSSDPDTVAQIPASQGPMTLTVKGRTSGTLVLTVQASDDFRSGMDTIAIGNLTWTASGAGFASGTMSASVAQTLGSWTVGSHTGSQSYLLRNSWSYAVGNYSTTVTYTVTAP